MIRPLRFVPILFAVAAIAFVVSGCGTQKIVVPKADSTYSADAAAAQLFNQRCGGCHTLSAAATFGSGQNPRDYLEISGPNFNERCERPVDRVLYAIENGGFSGAYMPQNIVVGKQAREVAMFVAKFAGRDAPAEPGVATCDSQAIGTLPALPSASGN
jgi:mono/diheme cytochrome c family protein